MVPVTNELVAIATDLPLDHLIYQFQHNSSEDTTSAEAYLAPTMAASEDLLSSNFSLIIPKDRIVQNPVAELFKAHHSTNTMLEDENKGNLSTSNVTATSGNNVDRTPGDATLEDKLDQILNLMKRMDGQPNAKQTPAQHPEKTNSNLRSRVEATMEDTSRSGPIDITAMINSKSVKFKGPVTDDEHSVLDIKERTLNEAVRPDNCQNDTLKSPEILTGRSDRKTLKESSLGFDSDSTINLGVNRTRGFTSEIITNSAEKVTRLLENRLKEKQGGPVDVTALLASESATVSSSQDVDDNFEILEGENDGNEKLEAGKLGGDDKGKDAGTGDVIDLTGLRLNRIEGDMTKMLQVKQEKVS